MRDEDKTKEELIQELVKLRKQLAEATGRVQKTEEICAEDDTGKVCVTPEGPVAFGAQEPWLPIETKLIAVCVGMGVVILIGLAVLVNVLLLGGH